MSDLLRRMLARASNLADGLRGEAHPSASSAYDRTGLLVDEGTRLAVLHDADGVYFPSYPSLAHSFWRAQEFSLFRQICADLPRPILDLGCGDGSFAAMLFEHVEYGVDIDPDALAAAEHFGLYGALVPWTADGAEVAAGSVGTVISNSVLEHVSDLDAVLRMCATVLRPGGKLVFTSPTPAFTEHLARYFGRHTADKVNRESVHRQLLGPDEWRDRLTAHGFDVERVVEYQPPEFTYAYRMLRLIGRRGLGRFVPDLAGRLWRRRRGAFVQSVKDSIEGVADGANVFIVARRR